MKFKIRTAGKKKAKSDSQNWPITSRWTAIGTVVACSAIGGKTINVAYAQSVPQASGGRSQTQAQRFDIAAGPLSEVLAEFARAAGITFALSPDSIGAVASPGVSGTFTIQEALRHFLQGTSVTFRFTTPTAVIFELRPQHESVTVQGLAPGADPYADPDAPYKADRLSSDKFTEPILNTARTETVLTQEALEDKNATTLREVLRSTAGITLGSGEGGNAFGDRFFIRGFDARNDVFIDGVRDPGVSIRENFDDEQVEILRGPASSFAGRGTTGGALNVVTKQAQNTDFYHLGVEGGLGDSTRRATVDINKRISPVLDVRFNGMIQYADVAERNYTTDNRWGAAGNVVYHPTENFKVTANYSHSYLWGIPDFGVPTNQVTREPVTESGVPRDTFYGAANRDFTKATQDIGTLDAEWKLSEHVTLENKFRASHSLLNYIGTIPENPSASGATAPYSSTLTFYSGYVQLNAQSRYEPVSVINDQPELILKFNTGVIRHTAILGGEFSNEQISIQGYSGLTSELTTGPVAFASTGAPIVSVLNPPNYLYGGTPITLAGNPLKYKVDTNAGYLMDTANYHDFLILNAGIRYDDYHIGAANNTSSQSANDGIPTWNANLVVKPVKIGSIYVAYAIAADPVGDELDATSSSYGGLAATQNATQIFGPQKSRSYEVGTKWELFHQHLLATAAVFKTEVTNARETAPAGLPGYTSGQIVAGAAYRVNGVDFELAGKITSRWSILGGLVLMDPKVTKSIVPTNVGLQLANIAPQSFNLLTRYQLTRRLEIGGQSVFASKILGGSLLAANGGIAYPGTPNPTFIPSYWRFDVFVEQRINSLMSLKLYGQNLTNKLYYDSLYQSSQPFVKVAPGRVVYLSLAFNFIRVSDPRMLIAIPDVLSKDDVADFRCIMAAEVWEDGRSTAGAQSAEVKKNEQLPPDSRTARQLGERILRGLAANTLFISASVPLHIFPPLFNRYVPGQFFGEHVDNCIRGDRLTGLRIRTDLSATLFLSEPDEYDGGELVVDDYYGSHRVKLPAGHLVLYPSTSLHLVTPVTRGVRISSFFWLQSMIKDPLARRMTFDMDNAIQRLVDRLGRNDPEVNKLTNIYHNLIRYWAEL